MYVCVERVYVRMCACAFVCHRVREHVRGYHRHRAQALNAPSQFLTHLVDLVFCQSLKESMHLERRSTFLLKGGCFGSVVSMPGGMRDKAVLERCSTPLHKIVK